MVIKRNFFNLEMISKIHNINIIRKRIILNLYFVHKQTSKKGRYKSRFYVSSNRYKSKKSKLEEIRRIVLKDKKVKVPVRTRYNYRRL